jgi:hypothetical protein
MGSHKGWIAGLEGINELLNYNRIPILTTIVKRRVLQDTGGFCTRPPVQNAEDYELWLRLLAKGYRGYGMEAVLARYRRHPMAATAAVTPDKLFWPACAALVEVADKVPDYRKQLMDDLVPILLYWFEFYTDAPAPELTQLFASYFGIIGRRVPGELALLLHLPKGSRIARKYFRSRYVHR